MMLTTKKIKKANFVIDKGNLQGNEFKNYFSEKDKIKIISEKNKMGKSRTMYELLVLANFYKDICSAKKAWTKTGEEIPAGFNTFRKISNNIIREITILYPVIEKVK